MCMFFGVDKELMNGTEGAANENGEQNRTNLGSMRIEVSRDEGGLILKECKNGHTSVKAQSRKRDRKTGVRQRQQGPHRTSTHNST